jgi:phytoene dehydrogenase-like protein
MKKRIVIIGAGMGGLAAGISGQKAGFDTVIFESHSLPGGQCTGWKRQGYVFDGCIHYFGGSGGRRTPFDAFWADLGAFPCEMIPTREAISVVSAQGECFHDLFDPDALETHMKELSPQDASAIEGYLRGIRKFIECNPLIDMSFGNFRQKAAVFPAMIARLTYMTKSLEWYARKFKHPLLKAAFPLLHYSAPGVPLFLQLAKHSDAATGSCAWPKGGGLAIARGMADAYRSLGGDIRYRASVVRIRTEKGRAVGVELADGSFHAADYVISNADGRKTIQGMLEGKYVNRKILKACEPGPDKPVPWGLAVYLGVKRDLAGQPSSLAMFLKEPTVIAGERCEHIDVQMYGHDVSMAPAGKGVMKVELFAKPSYFADLRKDNEAYETEKERIADQVIDLLEQRFPGIRGDIEVSDVTTLKSWERYMGGTNGFWNFPNRRFSIFGILSDSRKKYMLPGLKNFYMTGQWVTQAGALYLNAESGIRVIRKIGAEKAAG